MVDGNPLRYPLLPAGETEIESEPISGEGEVRMKATNERKVDLAKDILLAYIAHSPEDSRGVENVIDAAKKIFGAVDSLVETEGPSREQAGFRL